MTSLVPVFLVVLISVVVSGWKNDFHGTLDFQCPSDMSFISRFKSTYTNYYEDRRFDFDCKDVPVVSESVICNWTDYVNKYDAKVMFTCPNQGYINGMHSIHNSYYADRRFKFRCCSPSSGLNLRNCQWTDYVNGWDSDIDYQVPDGYVIRGVTSIHNNYYEYTEMASLVPVFLVVLISVVVSGWKNDFDRPLDFQCPSDLSSISRFKSTHSNHYEDRRFDLGCRQVPALTGSVTCSWSGYVNNYDAKIFYTCPNQGYINGMHSVHSNHNEDRRFKFRCCSPPSGLNFRNCHWTGYVNGWDSYVNYNVPYGYVIRGVFSVHDNGKEDRRFQFEICRSV